MDATTSENLATITIVAIALAILGWGLYRAKNFGKLGFIAWLQSAVLMAPWLTFFALFALGIYVNLVTILFLLVFCTVGYIYLGKKLRQLANELDQSAKQISTTPQPDAELTSKAELESTSDIPHVPHTPADNIPLKRPSLPEIFPMPTDDLQAVKGIFGIDTFFSTQVISYQDGAIFKGNLRGDPETTHNRLSASLKDRLGDRYRLFLVESPEEKPVVVVLPSKNDPQPLTTSQYIVAAILFIFTLATSLEAGGILLGFDYFQQPQRYMEVLPIALGLWLVLGSHEIAHQVLAKKHQVKFSLPFFIPTWQIGSFGAMNRFTSLLPNRSVLFDVAAAGPLAGGIVSLLMLFIGLVLSQPNSLFKVPAAFFQGSVLVGTLAKTVLGSALNQAVVPVHPLVIIGWLGLVITALNLLPAGQLDGGRIVQAIYGRKTARVSTIISFIFLAIASFVNPLALYWAIVIIFLQRDLERPCLNELTEPDDNRAALGLLALFLMIATLLPLTPGLAGRLGIGIL
jgi:membrane-associated protease RseP (regulator of RpoE activity)